MLWIDPTQEKISLILITVGCLLFGRLLWAVYLYPFYSSPYLILPQAKQRKSWIGIILEPLQNGSRVLEYLDNTLNQGIFRALDLLNREVLVITSPEFIKEILQTNAYDFCKMANVQNFMKVLLGDGLLTVDGEDHKQQRKALNPAFSAKHVQQLHSVFYSKTREMVSYIKEEINTSQDQQGIAVDITAWVNRAALDIIGIAALGIDFNSLADPTNELSRAYQVIFEPDNTSNIIFLLSIFFTTWAVKLLPLKKAREIRAGSAFVKRYIEEVVTRKTREHDDEKTSHKDILSVAAQYGKLSTNEIVNQARTFLVAGHETTATAMQWALYTLTRPENLHIQQRLRDEIHKQLPPLDSVQEISAYTLGKNLPYLDAVSKECLRVYGPSPFSRRTAVRDTVLCGISIKKGTNFLIPNWAINKSKKLWGERAREFDPERWLHGNEAHNGGADALAFQTFSSGTRGCIGKSFALAEFKIMLAGLVGTFEITKAADEKEVETEWAIIARIYNGFKVNMKPVTNW
ncbi:cytochrome P450 [Bipolaris maydis]|nr:cytochrome P450 [Bipolaris maydis]KAJ6202219.1 cytochrome P450 [Bipolaris maydis]KAJ6210770.1 cytochrome P450 [Bipolaris maydis]